MVIYLVFLSFSLKIQMNTKKKFLSKGQKLQDSAHLSNKNQHHLVTQTSTWVKFTKSVVMNLVDLAQVELTATQKNMTFSTEKVEYWTSFKNKNCMPSFMRL